MKKYIIPTIMVFAFILDANAAVKIKNSTAQRYMEQSENTESEEAVDEETAIATLENDIRILDEEIEKCKKQKKGWIAATVVGAAGVVATGTAAAVQGVKIKEKKDIAEEKRREVDAKNRELLELQNKTRDLK